MAPLHVGITVNADSVAVAPANQLTDGDAVGLSRKIPKCNLNSRDSAALSGMKPKLLDAAEQLFHIARIFSHQTAFQHCGIRAAGRVPNLSVSDNALIGINFHQRTVLWRTIDVRKPNICDFQLGGRRIVVHQKYPPFFTTSTADIPLSTHARISVSLQ